MAPARFAVVLRERLGQESYEALEEMIQVRQANLLTVDRFEQRLSEELGKVRVEMSGLRSDLRGEMAAMRSELKGDIGDLRSELKGDIGDLRSELKGDIQKLGADIRVDIAQRSAELMKWAMVFWVAQAAAVAGIITALR